MSTSKFGPLTPAEQGQLDELRERMDAEGWPAILSAQLIARYAGLSLVLTRGSAYVTLSRIVVADRNAGTGSAVLAAITEAADRYGDTLVLTPKAMAGTTSRARLVRFYRGFGFVENKGRNRDYGTQEDMYRRPLAK